MARDEAAREDGDGTEGSCAFEKYYQEEIEGLDPIAPGSQAGGNPVDSS